MEKDGTDSKNYQQSADLNQCQGSNNELSMVLSDAVPKMAPMVKDKSSEERTCFMRSDMCMLYALKDVEDEPVVQLQPFSIRQSFLWGKFCFI